MPTEPDALVTLGVVVRAHGLRGELRIKPWNTESDLWPDLESVVLIAPDRSQRTYAVAASRGSADSPILLLEGVGSREAAEALRGSEVAVQRGAFPELDEDEVYLADLVGLEVFEGERRIGVVDGIFEYPSVDCLRVDCEDGIRELPMLDQFVVGIDPDKRRIEAANVDELPVEPKRGSKGR